jgi:hypothetical protein
VEPNTALLDWGTFGSDAERLAELLARLSDEDLNQLVYSHGPAPPGAGVPRIDVWWRPGGGNLALSLSLVRFITASPWLSRAEVRFLLISDDPANNDILRTTTRRHLHDNRVDATIKVINNATEAKSFEEWVARESSGAVLTVVALPNQPGPGDREFLSRMERLFKELGEVLMIRPSSAFKELLSAGRAASSSLFPPAPGTVGAIEMPPLAFPATPDLNRAAVEIAEHYKGLVDAFDQHCLARLYGVNIELIRRVKAAVERQLSLVERGLSGSDFRRRLHLVNRLSPQWPDRCAAPWSGPCDRPRA